ncbi:MAG: Planctomycete cytochrome, partial [Phycisphaerales bacterium]|nr:Planctomycete cytochrome [Phycisphaerales bacterium]
MRRLSFDLIGLPPMPAEVSEYISDERADAYEQLVDRLLASPHYGERWARHWLDVARFGESDGFERDALRANAWRYRDWVIRALNADLPFDEFARMQIAGDVLRPGDADGVIATGFLTAGPWDEVGQ